MQAYPYEWLRRFISGRPWLCGDDETYLVSSDQRRALMARDPFHLTPERETYLLGFIDGWIRAKK